MSCKRIGHKQKQEFLLEFLKFIGVTEAYVEFPEAVAEMAPVLDMTLCQQFGKMKKKGTADMTFIKAHEKQIRALVDNADIDATLAVTDGVQQ